MGQVRFQLLFLISFCLLVQLSWGQTDSLNISWDRNPTEDSVAYYILYRALSNTDTNFTVNEYVNINDHVPQTAPGISRVETVDNSNEIQPGYFISFMVVAVDEQGLRSDFSDSKGKGIPQIRWQRTEINSGVSTSISLSEFLWDLDTPLNELILSITQISHLKDSLVSTNLWLRPDPPSYTGPADFILTVTDQDGFWDHNTINLIIVSDTTEQNNDPIAVDDQITTYQNQAVTFNPLINDSDPDSDPIFLVLPFPVLPRHGTLELLNNSQIRYTPATDYIGQDNFNYQISDGRGGRDTATIIINVLEDTLNHNPMATDDNVSTNKETSISINPLVNDSDPDGDQISLLEPFPVLPQHGTLELLNDSLVQYTPITDYTGQDNFDYQISDGRGGRDTATVSVTVQAVQVSGENTIVFPNPVKISDGQTLLVFEPIPSEAQELWLVSPALGYIVYKKVFEGTPPSRLELSLLDNDLKDLASGFYIYLIKGKGDKKLKSGKIAIIR